MRINEDLWNWSRHRAGSLTRGCPVPSAHGVKIGKSEVEEVRGPRRGCDCDCDWDCDWDCVRLGANAKWSFALVVDSGRAVARECPIKRTKVTNQCLLGAYLTS